MKYLFLVLFSLPALCFGQKNYCRQIAKTVDENGKTYTSPDSKYISVIKQLNINFFGLRLYCKDGEKHFDATGVAIEFEDSTVLRNADAKIDCRQEMAHLNAGYSTGTSSGFSGDYFLQAFFHINEENVEKFITKKITRIQLHDVSKKIPDKDAVRILNYIKCMQSKN